MIPIVCVCVCVCVYVCIGLRGMVSSYGKMVLCSFFLLDDSNPPLSEALSHVILTSKPTNAYES